MTNRHSLHYVISRPESFVAKLIDKKHFRHGYSCYNTVMSVYACVMCDVENFRIMPGINNEFDSLLPTINKSENGVKL